MQPHQMRKINAYLLGILFVLTSCSSNKRMVRQQAVEPKDNIPFEQLHMIRVLPTFIASHIQPKELWQLLQHELNEIGPVHTPQDTSLDRLIQEESKPFAILVFNVEQIMSSMEDRLLPVICIRCRLLEKTILTINHLEWMSTVWEKTSYVEITPSTEKISQNISQEIKSAVKELSEKYNSQENRPSFYLSNPI